MTLMRYNPMRDFDELFERFNRPFGGERGLQTLTRADWMPSVDITESDKEFLIKVEVPEIPREAIKLEIRNGMLTISGERKQEKEDKKQHRIERYYGSFTRSFSVPESVDESAVSAEQRDGMLYVHLKKAKAKKPKTTEIEIS